MKKIYLEPTFRYSCKSSNDYDVDTSTDFDGRKHYKFVFNNHYYYSKKELEFTPKHGLVDKDTGAEIISQLLSIYNSFHHNHDEKIFTDSLLKIFKTYGTLFEHSNSHVSSYIIDNYLGLISNLSSTLTILSKPFPLNMEQCNSLVKSIVFFIFYDCDGLEFAGQYIPEMPLHTLQRESFYSNMDYGECFYSDKLRKRLSSAHIVAYQDDGYGGYNEAIFEAKNVITELCNLIELESFEVIQNNLTYISEDMYKALSFINNCLQENKIEIKTDEETCLTYVKKINYDFTNDYIQLATIASSLVSIFLEYTSSRCAPIHSTKIASGKLIRELYFPVNSFFDAIIESFLLSDFDNYEYRECALETCSNQYWVNKKQSKKKYCCRAHARTAATHRFREEQ